MMLYRDCFAQDINCWDEKAILARADFIYQQVIQIWPSIGEAEVRDNYSFSKPKSVTICGKTHIISPQTWRQFTITIVEWAILASPEAFVTAQQSLTTYFKSSSQAQQSFNNCYRLSNGVWLAQNLSAKQHYNFCQRFLLKVGVSEDDWSWEKVED